jgi:hypothetical protein
VCLLIYLRRIICWFVCLFWYFLCFNFSFVLIVCLFCLSVFQSFVCYVCLFVSYTISTITRISITSIRFFVSVLLNHSPFLLSYFKSPSLYSIYLFSEYAAHVIPHLKVSYIMHIKSKVKTVKKEISNLTFESGCGAEAWSLIYRASRREWQTVSKVK